MSESYCEVSLGDYDGDTASFYDERENVKARKAHRCYECAEDIAVGQHHAVVTGKWDGELRTYRFCLACWEIIGEFSESGKTFGVVWDVFDSEWNNGATLQGCLNRVTSTAAKELMTRQWRKFKKIPA